MPPKKKNHSSSSSGTSSKKLNPKQNSEPSKFGIQLFFGRHPESQCKKDGPKKAPKAPVAVQNYSSGSDSTFQTFSDDPDPRKSDSGRGASEARPVIENRLVLEVSGPYDAAPKLQEPANQPKLRPCKLKGVPDFATRNSEKTSSTDKNPRNVLQAIDPNKPSQNTPHENPITMAINADENQSEASPESSKSSSVKRVKFSPGVLIKPSQDDGSNEVTWKISPITERLKMMSKHTLQASPDTVGHFGNLLSSPKLKGMDRTWVLSNKPGLKRVNLELVKDMHGNPFNTNSNAVPDGQCPFKTPPLSYRSEKVQSMNNVTCNEICNQLDFGQPKKALLELLDQVEDVVSAEDSVFDDAKTHSPAAENEISSKIYGKVDSGMNVPAAGAGNKSDRSFDNRDFLVLEVSEKCKSTDSSGARHHFKVLRLLNEQIGIECLVHLWDEWFYSIVSPGDTVGVIGQFNNQGICSVDCDKNLLIVHPDMLVSGTRVASSFNCPRRSVLDERLKCSEQSTAALLGTLLHQFFQAALIKEIPTKGFLEEYASIVLQKNVESMYACGVNETDMMKALIEAVPKILSWVTYFKGPQDSKAPAVDFGSEDGHKNIKISEVIDIEEMAWAPKYGLRGMIDASLRVKVKSEAGEIGEKIVPLELKTGRSTSGQSAIEHRAQVILYTLLMSERYLGNIDSGLLYYLHTDKTQEITSQRSDLIGLIMRRNELANDILKASTTQQLPPMSQSPSMCRSCRHLASCTVYHKAHGGNADSSGLGDVFESHVNHLTATHYAFLRHWDHLIDLEAKVTQDAKKEIWHSDGSEFNNPATCLPSVPDSKYVLTEELPVQDNDQFIYQFRRQDLHCSDVEAKEIDPLDCSLHAGDYVTISCEFGHVAIASGIIKEISNFHVSVSFSKLLRLPSSYCSLEAKNILHHVWRINKDENLTSFSVMRFNLVQLFIQNEKSFHLRKMIIDLELPRFDSGCIFSQDPAISYVWSEKSLNNDQRNAILKILTARDYALILGMPGTGKTSTMVHAVKALLMRGASILLTSYTNSAIDNLLVKLKAQSIDFIRIGRKNAVHEEIRGHCISAMDLPRVEKIKLRLEQVKVVAVTCLGITNPLLSNKKFDVCIMDEAGQTTLPVSLGPLMFSSTFVLVGDHYQLPPLVQSTEARESGMGVSLFCRLSEAHPQAISALQSQYRMCQRIMELSNALIYDNRLRCGSPEVANAKLSFSCSNFISSWLGEVLDSNKPVVFINTDMLNAIEIKEQNAVNNPVEADIIAGVTKNLIRHGIKEEDIGIITPYNSQANLIRSVLNVKFVEIHTIDKYQGRDKDCILVSFVRSRKNPRSCSSSLLGDWHRINVALTRAKKKLIMVGSCRTLSKVPLLRLLIDNVSAHSGISNASPQDGPLKRCPFQL